MKAHFQFKNHRGFSLVVTLSLMMLLLIVAVSLLSLVGISTRTEGISSAEARARANARMALMMAIDQLQSHMGPDQRISANASILSDSTVANPQWMGVWESWRAGEDRSNRPNPDEDSNHSTIFKGLEGDPVAGSMHPTYETNRADHFREWLVSLDDGYAEQIASGHSLDLNPAIAPRGEDTAVVLVGSGSLGKEAPDNQHVGASLIPVHSNSAESAQTGRYGWWVGDNSQKAIIMGDRYRANEALTSADKLFRTQAPGSTGTTTTEGLEKITNQKQLHAVASLKTLDLVDGVVGEPSKTKFHDITTQSFGVLADVREGGLKRDLSTLLERDVERTETYDDFMLYKFHTKDAWANDKGTYPNLPDTPQECVPMQDLAAFYQLYDKRRKGGIEYDSKDLSDSIHVIDPYYGNVKNFQTKFKEQYTTLYRNPVPVKVQFLLSLVANDITQADRNGKHNGLIPPTDKYKLNLAVIPAITLWNPYNVPLVMKAGEGRGRQIVVKPPPMLIRFAKYDGGGARTYQALQLNLAFAATGGNSIGIAEARSDLLRLNFARREPILFEPGEVKVFALPNTVNTQTYTTNWGGPQSMSSPHNLVDASLGWNPNGYQFFRNSCPIKGQLPHTKNVLWDRDTGGWALSLAPGDLLRCQVSHENSDKRTNVSYAVSPMGSPLTFYMAQRNFAAEGDGSGKGYSFTNLKHFSVVSRFGGSSNSRRGTSTQERWEFNKEFVSLGMGTTNGWIRSIEKIPADNIAAATQAGESWPFLQFAAMAGCETNELANGGMAGGRKFHSRPFLHSSPFQSTVIDSLDATGHYNHGWNWWIEEMNSVLEALVQESQSGNGFYGGGYSSESGSTHVVQQEIPVAPPISIAGLSHARLGGFSLAAEAPAAEGLTGISAMEWKGRYGGQAVSNPSPTLGFQRVATTGQGGLFPHVLQAIGNSYANPNLDADAAYKLDWKRTYDLDDGERDVTFADHSYLANKALWDDYFFSSITPQSSSIGIFSESGREAKELAEYFFFYGEDLPNRRLRPYLRNMDEEILGGLFDQYDLRSGGLADKASHLMVEGPFNVNTTSVDAWRILFSSLKGKSIAYLNEGTEPLHASSNDQVPVGMGMLPTGTPVDSAATDNPANPGQWKGARLISEEEIDALAQAMVREVKKRGPFLSLSEFVNRRLDPNNTEGMALKGALQAALDYDGSDDAGPEVTINKQFRGNVRLIARNGDIRGDANQFAFPEALKGPAAYGSSAYVDQADILRNFAAQLTPRGDTFTIRAYGDSLDVNGNVVARAWCEAVVQRMPNYIDSEDESHAKQADLISNVNQLFGRKIELISFRWLNASEV